MFGAGFFYWDLSHSLELPTSGGQQSRVELSGGCRSGFAPSGRQSRRLPQPLYTPKRLSHIDLLGLTVRTISPS